ncbi:Activin receptor type-2A [Dirofilaria immitis]
MQMKFYLYSFDDSNYDYQLMKFSIIAYTFIIINLFHLAQSLQCYASVGNVSFIKQCIPKDEEREMCFATKFGANGLCVRGCSYEISYYGGYEYSLNCSGPICMANLGCCCKGDLCNDKCFNKATSIRYSPLAILPLMILKFFY